MTPTIIYEIAGQTTLSRKRHNYAVTTIPSDTRVICNKMDESAADVDVTLLDLKESHSEPFITIPTAATIITLPPSIFTGCEAGQQFHKL